MGTAPARASVSPAWGADTLVDPYDRSEYAEQSPFGQVVSDVASAASEVSAVMARLPTKSCTCSAPFLMPGCATGLSGLNLPTWFVPQSMRNTPRDARRSGLGTTTLAATRWIAR